MIRILVLVLALLQPIASYLSTIGNARFMDQASNPLITPAGYAFSIWGVITFGSLLYAIYQVLPKRRNRELYDRIAPYAAGLFAGFSIWLFAAEKDWLWATVVIFTGMGYFLYRLYPHILAAVREKKLSLAETVVTYGTFGLYAGWTTIAIFANIAAALKFSGVSDTDGAGILWQAGILVLAAMTAIALLLRTKGSLPYAAAMLWGFVAIVVGTLERGPVALPLTGLAAAASLALLGAYVYARTTRKP
ncbi:MAG: hypothetical protein V4644_03675 [Patescibacteria group bacterium]